MGWRRLLFHGLGGGGLWELFAELMGQISSLLRPVLWWRDEGRLVVLFRWGEGSPLFHLIWNESRGWVIVPLLGCLICLIFLWLRHRTPGGPGNSPQP